MGAGTTARLAAVAATPLRLVRLVAPPPLLSSPVEEDLDPLDPRELSRQIVAEVRRILGNDYQMFEEDHYLPTSKKMSQTVAIATTIPITFARSRHACSSSEERRVFIAQP